MELEVGPGNVREIFDRCVCGVQGASCTLAPPRAKGFVCRAITHHGLGLETRDVRAYARFNSVIHSQLPLRSRMLSDRWITPPLPFPVPLPLCKLPVRGCAAAVHIGLHTVRRFPLSDVPASITAWRFTDGPNSGSDVFTEELPH
jgi:hypothetical protein